MRKNTPPWYALSGWEKKHKNKTKQIKHINIFQLFGASFLLEKIHFSPVHSPLWAINWEGTEGIEPSTGLQSYSRANCGYYCSSTTQFLSTALLGRKREGDQQLHCTEGNTKTRAGPPNPVSLQDHSCSDLPPFLSYKHTYPKQWFLFADAKSVIFQYNSVHCDDTREF